MEDYLKRRDSHVTTKAWRAMEEDKETLSSKRRKFFPEPKKDVLSAGEALPLPTTGNSVSPAASRTNYGGSDNDEEYSSDFVEKRSSDLQNDDNLPSDSLGTGISTSVDRVSREATPTSELYGDSEEILLQSFSTLKRKPSGAPAISCRKIAENTPSAAELEEFFAAAEKYDQKRFAEKYNYDIVKDVPLEGKYQWVPLNEIIMKEKKASFH